MKDIKRYIREGREKGVSDKKLKQHLVDNDFSESDVEKAFNDLDGHESSNDSKNVSSSGQGRKDVAEKIFDNNKGIKKFARGYSRFSIGVGKIRYVVSFIISGILLLLGIVLAIALGSATFLAISAFFIIPGGLGLYWRYQIKRMEKYWKEMEERENGQKYSEKASSKEIGKEPNDGGYYDFSKKSTIGMYSYAFGFLFGFFGFGWLPALIFYKTRDDKVDKEHSRRALNWNLSYLVYFVLAAFLSLVLDIGLLGGVFLFAAFVLQIVFSFIGANKASKGEFWSPAISISFVSSKNK